MNSKKFTYFLILLGAAIGIYAEAYRDKDIFLLILAILILMIGLFRLSKGITGKKPEQSYIQSEEEE